MVTVCGIEEAGRGPIIGPMVMVGLLAEEKDIPRLKEIGAKDSKLLTPKQRENLFEKILGIIKDKVIIIISPKEIDDAVESASLNLNWLEAEKTAEMINRLKPDRAILDCPSNNIKAYTNYVRERLDNKSTEIIAEHKADVKYSIVSAASIIAKVTRDREIEKIKKKIGIDIGSGYPADPVTKEFIKNNHSSHPEILRHSWSTYKALKGNEKQKKITGF